MPATTSLPIRLLCISALGLVTMACGGSSATPPASAPASSTPSRSSSPSPSSAARIVVGDKVLVSTLQPPSSDFGTGPNVTEGAEGLTLTVAKPGTYTYSEPNNASPIPINGFEVHVALDDSAAGNLYFGIACRGMDINNTYLLLFNATGKWVIVQVKGGNQTPLAQGTDTSMKSGTIHVLDAACVTAGDNQNQVSLAIDSSIVGQATGSASDVPASNVVALFAYSQDSSSTGSVTFGSITVYRAQI